MQPPLPPLLLLLCAVCVAELKAVRSFAVSVAPRLQQGLSEREREGEKAREKGEREETVKDEDEGHWERGKVKVVTATAAAATTAAAAAGQTQQTTSQPVFVSLAEPISQFPAPVHQVTELPAAAIAIEGE